MFKKLIILALPAVAAGAPMAYYSGPEWISTMTASLEAGAETTEEVAGNPGKPKSQAGDGKASAPRSGRAPKTPPAPKGPPVEGAAVGSFEEVLRFDISQAWIVSRWPRVSASLADLQLQGYRVPLVTGTTPSDLAGSLTYYFDAQHRLQRITFQGTTGDFGRLAQTLMGRFRFVRRPTNTPSVVLFEFPSQTAESPSYLWIETVPVIKSDDLYGRYKLTLVLERPDTA